MKYLISLLLLGSSVFAGVPGGPYSPPPGGSGSITNLPSYIVTNNQTGVTLSGTFAGDGSGVTNIWALAATNVSQIQPRIDWGSAFVTGSTMPNVNGHYYFLSTNSGVVTWTNTTGDYRVVRDSVESQTRIEDTATEGWQFLGELVFVSPIELQVFSGTGSNPYVSLGTNTTAYNTIPAAVSSVPILQPFTENKWEVDSILGDDSHAIKKVIPFKTLGAAISNAVAGDVIHVRAGLFTNEGSSVVSIPCRDLTIYGDGQGTVVSNEITLAMASGLTLRNICFLGAIFSGAGTNITFDCVEAINSRSDVIICDGAIDNFRMTDCNLKSAWDCIALRNSGPYGLAELRNVTMTGSGAQTSMQPYHAHNIESRIYGGSINVTNTSASGSATCIMTPPLGNTGTNTIYVSGVVLNHKDNTGTNTPAILIAGTNQSVFGWYLDNGTLRLGTNTTFAGTPSTSGITTNYTVPGGATFYITNGVIMKVQ